jgi:putative tryptophan/tyrosine transport system substrate-binding protein
MRKGIQRRAQVLAADDPMRRRDFLTVLAVATAWASAVRGQEPRRVLGFLSGFTASSAPPGTLPAFIQGLKETGFVEGGNVSIEFRWADGHYDRLPSVAAELVGRNVAVIFAYDLPSALAAKAATKTIPIVFATGADPVKMGLVESLGRPNSNVTGVSIFFSLLGPKHVEILHELLPAVKTIALLGNPANPNFQAGVADIRAATDVLEQGLEVLTASTDGDLEAAFATMVQHQVGALTLVPDPFFISRPDRLIELAARHKIPAIYPIRTFTDEGGLMSYASRVEDLFGQAGIYVGKILNGAKPADLPVQQSTKVELVINLKTAKALGLTVPLSLLTRADEVIE